MVETRKKTKMGKKITHTIKKKIPTKSTGRKKFSIIHTVKRHGHKEPFDERKVYASVYEACFAERLSEKEAERIADNVCKGITKWMGKKEKITAREIHKEVVHLLKKHHRDVAFIYETHRDIS